MYMYMYLLFYVLLHVHVHQSFETWAKLAQQWLVCVCHWEYILSQLTKSNDVSDNIMIINCTIWPRDNCTSSLAKGAPYKLIKNTDLHVHIIWYVCKPLPVCQCLNSYAHVQCKMHYDVLHKSENSKTLHCLLISTQLS